MRTCLDLLETHGVRRQVVSLPVGTGKTVRRPPPMPSPPRPCPTHVPCAPCLQTIFSHLLRHVRPPTPEATKTLVLAHREELLDQAARRIAHVNPDLVRWFLHRTRASSCADAKRRAVGRREQVVDVDQGDRRASPLADVLVASVPTLGRASSNRLDIYDPAKFKCIIVDEVRAPIHPGTGPSSG